MNGNHRSFDFDDRIVLQFLDWRPNLTRKTLDSSPQDCAMKSHAQWVVLWNKTFFYNSQTVPSLAEFTSLDGSIRDVFGFRRIARNSIRYALGRASGGPHVVNYRRIGAGFRRILRISVRDIFGRALGGSHLIQLETFWGQTLGRWHLNTELSCYSSVMSTKIAPRGWTRAHNPLPAPAQPQRVKAHFTLH